MNDDETKKPTSIVDFQQRRMDAIGASEHEAGRAFALVQVDDDMIDTIGTADGGLVVFLTDVESLEGICASAEHAVKLGVALIEAAVLARQETGEIKRRDA